MAYLGVPLGRAVSGLFRDAITGFRARWQPVIAAHEAGKLDRSTISPGDYEAFTKGGVKLAVAWQSALHRLPTDRTRRLQGADVVDGDYRRPRRDGECQVIRRQAHRQTVTLTLVDGPSHSETLPRIDLWLDKVVDFHQESRIGILIFATASVQPASILMPGQPRRCVCASISTLEWC